MDLKKIEEAIKSYKNAPCGQIKALVSLAEQVLQVGNEMPEVQEVNYAPFPSQKHLLKTKQQEEKNKVIENCTLITAKLLSEKQNEIDILKKQLTTKAASV